MPDAETFKYLRLVRREYLRGLYDSPSNYFIKQR
jgi:hypothetical protein